MPSFSFVLFSNVLQSPIRAEIISSLIDKSIDRKLICIYFDNLVIVFNNDKNSQIPDSQIMIMIIIFFVKYSKLNECILVSDCQINHEMSRHRPGLLEITMGPFHNFLTFYGQ